MKEKINQTAGRLKQTVRAVGVGHCHTYRLFFMSAPAYAAGVQDSQVVTSPTSFSVPLTI